MKMLQEYRASTVIVMRIFFQCIQYKLQNSMKVDSVVIIATLSMSYITTRIIKTQTSVAKIPRVSVKNQITTLSVVKIDIKFSPCTAHKNVYLQFRNKYFNIHIIIPIDRLSNSIHICCSQTIQMQNLSPTGVFETALMTF